MSNEWCHDFGSSTPNFFLFKMDGVHYCLKEASIESTVLSGDFRLNTTAIETTEDDDKPLKPTNIGKANEAQLILLERNVYVCDPQSPQDPVKATQLIDPAVLRRWKTKDCKFLGDKLDEMSGMKDVSDKDAQLGNSPTP